MAIISGSLLAIGKALSSVASKSKSKKAATKSIKNKQLDNKKPKQKITPQQSVMGERGGALIKTSASAKPKTPKLENTGSKIGYEKINSQINNLVNISSSIDDALKKQYQAELDTRKARKESNQKARRANREALLEKGKGAAGILAGTIGAVGSKLGIFDFLKNILLGGLLLLLLKNIKKIMGALDFIRDNAYLLFALIRGAVQVFGKSIKLAFNLIKGGVKGVGKLIAGGIKNALRPVGTLFKKAGKGIASGLRRIGGAIFNLAKKSIQLIGNFLKKAPVLKQLFKFGKNISKLLTQSGKSAIKFAKNLMKPGVSGLGRLSNFVAKRVFDAKLGLKGAQKTAAPAVQALKNLGSKGLSGLKNVGKSLNIAPAMKGLAKAAKGIKIPIVGPLIVLIASLLSGEPAEKAVYKAIGTGLGEVLGTFIPIPVLGTIIGGLLGEYGGDLVYELIKGGGIETVKERVKNDFSKALEVGGKAFDFIKGGFGRLKDKIMEDHSFEIPDNLAIRLIPGFGLLAGKKVPDPRVLFDLPKMGELLKSSFFPDGFKMPSFTASEDAFLKPDEDLAAATPQTPLVNGVMKPPSVGESEQDLFRRLVYAEAGGEGIMGMALVARSVLNRAGLIQSGKASTGTFLAKDKTITGVIMGRNQYQPVSDGSINRKRSQAQLDDAQKAIDIALNTADLRGRLEAEGMDANSINKLLASTGFRTASAFNDASQNVNVTKYKNHLFNTAGNPGLSVETAKVSTDQLRLEESSVNPPQLTEEGMSSEQPQTGGEMQKSPSQSSSSQSSGSPISSSQGQKSTGNLEKFAGYEDGTNEEIIVPMQDQGPIPIPVPSGGGSSAGSFSSSSGLLNSYYKKQLLGLLYKVG